MSKNELRQSQLLTTFGPGSMVDLPDASVIVGGLDHWKYANDEPCMVTEPRLVIKLKQILGIPESEQLFLKTPPPLRDTHGFQPHISVYEFPEWFEVQRQVVTKEGFRRRKLVHIRFLQNHVYNHDGQNCRTVPVRFVRACSKGHIDDIDWYPFVHGARDNCRGQLWFEERGTSGNLEETNVVCDCGKGRSMREAIGGNVLGACSGRKPWLGWSVDFGCDKTSRLLIRAASNTYFPQVQTVISIPPAQSALDLVVRDLWDNFLCDVESTDDLAKVRRKPMAAPSLAGHTDDAVFDAIAKFRSGSSIEGAVKVSEVEALCSAKEELGEDQPEGDFFARALPPPKWQDVSLGGIERVVLVHRLREVSAQVGFTRFEAMGPRQDGDLDVDVERAPLAETVNWLPAIEIRGEGVFIQFSNDAIAKWLERPAVQRRRQEIVDGWSRWRSQRGIQRAEFLGVEYTMLHSLAHMLISTISLECGYPSSSLRERIYALQPRYGILLYTATSDAEGTLGGLVETSREIRRHLRSALDYGRLCSNDPVCSGHSPDDAEPLLGSACHGCLLISETSCEQHNNFLDRSLVVPTLHNRSSEFFE